MTKAAELAKMGEVLTNSQIGGRRNILINSAMQVAQRGTSLAMAHDGTNSDFLIDRWRTAFNAIDELDGTYAQVADHPLGGTGTSLKWTTGTAESAIASDEYGYIGQIIEAQNLQHLRYATSNAETITLSFYVKSSITGTFAVGFYKSDSTGRIFNKTYTINSANTWEKKTLTVVGDTDSGAGIVNDSGQGIWVSWHLGAGSDYSSGDSTSGWTDYANNKWASGQATNAVMTTAGATFQITECQLEVGEQATPFEHRSFGEELALCQRYYLLVGQGDLNPICNGQAYSSTVIYGVYPFPVEMRTSPSLEQTTGTNYYRFLRNGTSDFFNELEIEVNKTTRAVEFHVDSGVTNTAGHAGFIRTADASAYVALKSEL